MEVRNILEYRFSVKAIYNNNRVRDRTLHEIQMNICALFNSNGGKLILIIDDDTRGDNGDIVRPVEQRLKQVLHISELHKIIDVIEKKNKVTFVVAGLPILRTVKTNLCMTTNTEVQMISAMDDVNVKDILFERLVVEIPEQQVPEHFYLNRDCGLRELKTFQFKQLKTEKTRNNNFATRIINNKFKDYVSGFANGSGGQIFYGIHDSGVVLGEKFNETDIETEKQQITNEVEKTIQKMIWVGNSASEIKCGKQWDIKFVPVKNDENEIIQSTFVVVISVQPYIGGVFTAEPESYYVENGKVKKMPFDTWRENMYVKIEEPKVFERTSWSKHDEREYMKTTQYLEYLRQEGKWTAIKESCRKNDPGSVNISLINLFQLTAVHYRRGKETTAQKYLDKFSKRMSKDDVKDKSVFAVDQRYAASSIQRSSGNYSEAWSIIKEGFQLAENAPAGFVVASFYENAALVLSNLVHEKSFIGISEDDENFEKKVCEQINLAKEYCTLALQQLLYIDDEFEIAIEDLRQNIHIAWARLFLRSADKDALVSDSDIESATLHINKAEKSFLKVKVNLKFNYCRSLLVKSDLQLRKYQLTKPDILSEIVCSKQFVEQALQLADRHNFKEIEMQCTSRLETLQEIIDETKQTKVSEEELSSTDTED